MKLITVRNLYTAVLPDTQLCEFIVKTNFDRLISI